MSEQRVWSWLRDLMPTNARHLRVESGDTSPGIPDVYSRFSFGSGWMELKFDRHQKSETPFLRDGLRPDQIRWIRDEIELGGLVFIVAGFEHCVTFTWAIDEVPQSYNNVSRDIIISTADLILEKPLNSRRRKAYPQRIYELFQRRCSQCSLFSTEPVRSN